MPRKKKQTPPATSTDGSPVSKQHDKGGSGEGSRPNSSHAVRRLNMDADVGPQKTQNPDPISDFSSNRSSANGMSLSYIPPQLVDGKPLVVLDKADYDKEMEKWAYAMVLYVVGDDPYLKQNHSFIDEHCSMVAKPKLFRHDDGYFVVQFKSKQDFDTILGSGPYFFSNKPIILKQWVADFDVSKEILQTLSLWVQLQKLPVTCWSTDSLSRIASTLGKPLYADDRTKEQDRISYARVLVEVDITQEIPEEIEIQDPSGRVFTQKVVLEWRPVFCKKCLQVGHDFSVQEWTQVQRREEPYRKQNKAWVPKARKETVATTPSDAGIIPWSVQRPIISKVRPKTTSGDGLGTGSAVFIFHCKEKASYWSSLC